MQVSKDKLNAKVEKQIKSLLAQVIADLKTQKNIKIFLSDFLTSSENLVFAKRLAIIFYLQKGMSYEKIRRDLKVSSATIAGVQNVLERKSKGYMLVLERMKADAWAQEWSEKITKFFTNFSGKKSLRPRTA